MMFVDIFETAFAAEVASLFVGSSDGEFARAAMDWMNGAHSGFIIDGGVFTFLESDGVTPFAGFVRGKVRAPMFAGAGGAVSRVAVGREVTGDEIFGGAGFVAE